MEHAQRRYEKSYSVQNESFALLAKSHFLVFRFQNEIVAATKTTEFKAL